MLRNDCINGVLRVNSGLSEMRLRASKQHYTSVG
jgi:hypothetical protein